jgi:hypothetical protein
MSFRAEPSAFGRSHAGKRVEPLEQQAAGSQIDDAGTERTSC